jgi:hypothetical protein
MTERKAKGFHALERKIHEMEEEDRAGERKGEPQRKVETKDEERTRIKPPPAHDE